MEKEKSRENTAGEEENKESEEPAPYDSLPEVEKDFWIRFHENAYKDDLKHAKKDMIEFPRWSIISGYYAMHDITKLYLGIIHNIKITGENIHSRTLEALGRFIQDKKEKERIIELLKKAEISFFNVTRLQEKTISLMLRKGRTERGKTQYYSRDFQEINSQKSVYFLDNIVRPYISTMEEMLSADHEKPEEDDHKNAA